jgi:outer membrane murein-binding lipoprotein Lpp
MTMSNRHKRNSRVLVGLTALVLAGCGPPQERIDELEAAAAQRDTLLQEVADLAQLMSDVNAELADVQLEGVELAQAESPLQAERDSMLTKIRVLNTRFDSTETRLEDSRRRIRSLTQVSDSLRAQLEQTITNYERMLEAQRTNIAALTEHVQSLETDNVRLAATVDTLAAEVDTLRTAATTVYFIAGTKDELLEAGVVQKEGGARFLFIFGKRGETLVPARDFDISTFTPVDMWEATEIALPSPDKQYRIVSRQDLTYLAAPPDEKGLISGPTLQIGAPDGFWKSSKYLILVEE